MDGIAEGFGCLFKGLFIAVIIGVIGWLVAIGVMTWLILN